MKNSVTPEQVDAAIKTVAVQKVGTKTCVVLATLHNGYEILAHSSCVDAANYDDDVGAALAMHKIKDKIWELLGFELQSKLNPVQPATDAPAA